MQSPDLELYQALIEQVPTMLWRAGPDAGCDYVNATWLAFTGRTLPQELGTGWLDGVHPDDRAAYLALFRDHFERRQPFEVEYRLRRHDGAYRYVLARGAPHHHPDGSFAGFVGSCVDVDARRHREATAGADEFFEMSLDMLCVAGFDGYLKRVNPSWTRTLWWTPEELMSRPSIEFVHPEDRHDTLTGRGGLIQGVPLRALTNRYLRKDGTYRWFEWRSVSHVDQGLVYCVARDVTEQKEAQRALQELTESLTTTLNSIAEGVIATDADAAVVRMNPVAEKLTGWSTGEARGKPLTQIFHVVDGDTRATVALPLERTLRDGLAAFPPHALLIGRDGTELPIASSCAPKRNADGSVSGAVLVFRDLTAEKQAKEVQEQLQRQLIVADRMASVGTLAAGVAHEINNPLTFVKANVGLLLEEVQQTRPETFPARQEEWAQMALEAWQGTERIQKIVRGLKTFSRAPEERREVIDLRPVLELSANMAFTEIRHRARLVKDYGEVPLVEADDARLGQVFINLLINAMQALPADSTEAHEIRIVTATDEVGRAVVEVRDTGPGISPKVMGRIFDPFFTTKPVGIGTGLGLSICHNLVTSMGGQITARNNEDRGASFRVTLPAAAKR